MRGRGGSLTGEQIGDALDALQAEIRRAVEGKALPPCEHSFSISEPDCARCGAPAPFGDSDEISVSAL